MHIHENLILSTTREKVVAGDSLIYFQKMLHSNFILTFIVKIFYTSFMKKLFIRHQRHFFPQPAIKSLVAEPVHLIEAVFQHTQIIKLVATPMAVVDLKVDDGLQQLVDVVTLYVRAMLGGFMEVPDDAIMGNGGHCTLSQHADHLPYHLRTFLIALPLLFYFLVQVVVQRILMG